MSKICCCTMDRDYQLMIFKWCSDEPGEGTVLPTDHHLHLKQSIQAHIWGEKDNIIMQRKKPDPKIKRQKQDSCKTLSSWTFPSFFK